MKNQSKIGKSLESLFSYLKRGTKIAIQDIYDSINYGSAYKKKKLIKTLEERENELRSLRAQLSSFMNSYTSLSLEFNEMKKEFESLKQNYRTLEKTYRDSLVREKNLEETLKLTELSLSRKCEELKTLKTKWFSALQELISRDIIFKDLPYAFIDDKGIIRKVSGKALRLFEIIDRKQNQKFENYIGKYYFRILEKSEKERKDEREKISRNLEGGTLKGVCLNLRGKKIKFDIEVVPCIGPFDFKKNKPSFSGYLLLFNPSLSIYLKSFSKWLTKKKIKEVREYIGKINEFLINLSREEYREGKLGESYI